MDKEKSNKKYRIFIIFVLVTVISIGTLGTYAFFITQAGRNEEQKLTIKTGTLALIFEDNDEGLTANMELGKSYSKELTIRNTGTEAVTTNMIWSDLVNTYIEESLSYTLEYKTTEGGDWQTVETSHLNVPQIERAADYNLATDLTIPANTTYYYKVTITFNNLPDINQESDKTAILSTKFRLREEVKESESFKTLAHLKLYSKDSNPNFAEPSTTDETADGLYSLEDDYGTSYYYRGAVENNYVKFGGFYWRIIRINGDGSIRMQYDGTRAWPNGNGQSTFTAGDPDRFALILTSWNADNYNDVKYVGWMYGGTNGSPSTQKDGRTSASATYNETNPHIKTQVDTWYKTNIEDKGLSKYVSDEIFCNDRNLDESDSEYTNLGYGTNPSAFATNSILSTMKPKFTCTQKNDAFTVSDIEKGNGDLTYPIGLITLNEIVAAGSGKFNTANRSYYLYKTSTKYYWSLSPCSMGTNGYAYVFVIGTNGGPYNHYVHGSIAAAPVINIAPKYAVKLTGSGTMDSPYQIPGVE